MNIIKFFLTTISFFVTAAMHRLAMAADPFSQATDKTNEITDFLSGHFATAACTLVIVIAGLMWFAGRLKPEWALRIAGGAILIASAAEIASFLIG